MKRIWMAGVVIAGGLSPAMFGQQYPQNYPQQYPPNQGGPTYNDQYGNGQPGNGQYAPEQGYDPYNGDPAYDGNDQGVYAPAPPPAPSYAYAQPPMPGPGYTWVDGYWNLNGGRYSWVGGYWMRPPYTGGYWVAPRYSGGRFFVGFWGGGHGSFDRRFSGGRDRYVVRDRVPQRMTNFPAQNRSGFRGGDDRHERSGSRSNGRRR